MGKRISKQAPAERTLFPAEIFRRWQRNHRLTNAAVSRILQVRPQKVTQWRDEGIPTLVMWACIGYTDGRWRPKNLEALINPPLRENDMRRKNVPPHLRDTQDKPSAQPQRTPYRRPPAPIPEWPIDPIYD